MPASFWRLIDTGSLHGAANMAVDEALLECFQPNRSMPVLRLYGWSPPAFSLGRYQQAADVLDLELCAARGIPVVRRITGGGVIYHAEELTYSIVCTPNQLRETGTVKESFACLCAFLLDTYGKLGLKATFAVDSKASCGSLGQRAAFCFAGKEEYDIVIDGRKIGGNAQRRTRGIVFQHGSIPLQPRVSVAQDYLKEKIDNLDLNTACLADLGIEMGSTDLKKLVADCFAEIMQASLSPTALTAAEEAAVKRLHEEKYRSDSWNISSHSPRLIGGRGHQKS